MIVGVVEVPAYQGNGEGFFGHVVEFVEGYDVIVGVEESVGIGGPELVKSLDYLEVNKASTACGEAYFYSVDDAVCKVDVLSERILFRGIGRDGKAVIVEHTPLCLLVPGLVEWAVDHEYACDIGKGSDVEALAA